VLLSGSCSSGGSCSRGEGEGEREGEPEGAGEDVATAGSAGSGASGAAGMKAGLEALSELVLCTCTSGEAWGNSAVGVVTTTAPCSAVGGGRGAVGVGVRS
jgi:hypothetical protein